MDYPDEEPYEDEIDDESDGAERMNVSDIKLKSMQELTELAESMGIENAAGLRKQELIFKILEAQTEKKGLIFAEGVLEILPDGYGFLRAPTTTTCPARTTSTSRRRRSGASTCAPATRSSGQVRPPKEGERYFALLRSRRSTSSAREGAPTRSCSTT